MKPLHFLSLFLAAFVGRALAAAEPAPSANPTYPLHTCVVSGEELGSMGAPHVHLHQEAGKPPREVRFCCKGCEKKFNRDPGKYLEKLDEAQKEAKTPAPAAPATPDSHADHAH